MDWSQVVQQWRNTVDAVQQLGGLEIQLEIDDPATEAEVEAVEQELGMPLPSSFRDALRTFSKSVSLFWLLPDHGLLGEPFEQSAYGSCRWSLGEISEAEAIRQLCVDEVFPSWGIPGAESRWDDALAFHQTDFGDLIAIDLSETDKQPVIYLRHDDDTYNRCKLGTDFQDFLSRWAPLGCPGGDCGQWTPFVQSEESYIDPNCANAVQWKQALGLQGWTSA